MRSRINTFENQASLAAARAALKDNVVPGLAAGVQGRVLEIVSDGELRADSWPDGGAYVNAETPCSAAWGVGAAEGARLVIWLLGPERVADTAQVYHQLGRELADGAAVILASEVPWAGKKLCEGEYGEYTAEETTSALVLAGAERIVQMVEGPVFRLWHARIGGGRAHLSLVEAAERLTNGDWLGAENALATMEKPLTSLLAVREYALLAAGCRDLGDSRAACLEALSEVLRIDPCCARAMCGIGRIAALGGDLSTALEFFDAALKQEPALVAALHGRAVALEGLGDLAGALETARMAAELRPASAVMRAKVHQMGEALARPCEIAQP
ncbi:MAG: hypothetical protein PHU25_16445 [Deltaproteobacteria bacterium]|nr:hypothetical protein [Deltaproteobacteria bacterium]